MHDIKPYKNQLEVVDPISYDELVNLIYNDVVHLETFHKGEYLAKQDQICKAIYFLLEGTVRQYCLSKGEEANFLFYFENDVVFDHHSFLTSTPSIYNFQALDEVVTLSISKDALQELVKANTKWRQLYSRINEKAIVSLYKRNEVFLTQTPEERYLKLLEVHPKIMERISLAKIATFLGITVPSLSRIRNRIASRN